MRRILMLLLGVLVLCTGLQAQERTLTGRVVDAQNNGIPNASVTVKGSPVGTTTNANGIFSLTVPASAQTLVISGVGFTTQ